MSSLVILLRPGHDWPVMIAASRDAGHVRPARAPARHWPDRPEVTAALDGEGEGAWLGINAHGVVAALIRREGREGDTSGKRSRGELVLEALEHAESSAAAEALAELSASAYRPFNLVVADPRAAYWIRHAGDGAIRVAALAAGLRMLASTEVDDPDHPAIAARLAAFRAAAVPDPRHGDWSSWRALLADPACAQEAETEPGPFQGRRDGLRARSSALIALPAYPGFSGQPTWLHAEGGPDPEIFRAVL